MIQLTCGVQIDCRGDFNCIADAGVWHGGQYLFIATISLHQWVATVLRISLFVMLIVELISISVQFLASMSTEPCRTGRNFGSLVG